MSGFRNQVLTRVIIGGSGSSGLFLYAGNPGPGNPPVLAAVPPGVTKDPYGNSVLAVLNIGTFTAAHIGWDANGNTYVSDTAGKVRVLITGGAGGVWPGGTDPAVVFYNAQGAIILVVDPARGGTFQYQDLGTSSQGVLIGAQVGKNTTDPVNGTTVGAGVNLIDPAFGDTITIVGANINMNQIAFTKTTSDSANTGSTDQGPFRHLAAPEQTQAGHVVQRWYGTSVDGTRAAGTVISLTDPPTRQTPALLEIQGDLDLAEIAAPGAVATGPRLFGSSATGMLKFISDSTKGDSNAYQAGYLVTPMSSGGQLISSTGFTTIGGLSAPVAAQKYAFRARLVYTAAGTAGTADFQVSGPGVTGQWISATFIGNTIVGEGFQNGALGPVNSPSLATTAEIVDIEGEATFTAAGTIALQAAISAGGSNFTINKGHLWLYPMG